MNSFLRRFLKVTAATAVVTGLLRLVETRMQASMGGHGTATMARGRELSPDVATSCAYLTVMGGTDIDLRGAVMDPDGARLRIVTVMGGTRVLVPPGWRVETSGKAIMGGHEVQLTTSDDDGPVLTADMTTVMGGVLITDDVDKDVVIAVRIGDDEA